MTNRICGKEIKNSLILTEDLIDYLQSHSAISKEIKFNSQDLKEDSYKDILLEEIERRNSHSLFINALRFTGQFQLASLLDDDTKIINNNRNKKKELLTKLEIIKIINRKNSIQLNDITIEEREDKVKTSCFCWIKKKKSSKKLDEKKVDLNQIQKINNSIYNQLMEDSYKSKIFKYFEENLSILVFDIKRMEKGIILQLICNNDSQLTDLIKRINNSSISKELQYLLIDDNILNINKLTDIIIHLSTEQIVQTV